MTDQTTTAAAVSEASPIVDKLDQIVDDAITNQEPPKEEVKTEDVASDVENEVDESQEPQNKSYLNALAKAKGKMAKERFLRQEAEKRIADLEAKHKAPESKETQTVNDGRPKEEDYGKNGKTWGDYARDLARYEAKTFAEENKRTTQEQTSEIERQERIQERVEHAADNSVAAAKTFADFKQVETDNMDVIRSLPDTIKELLRESDNPAYAFYQLAKDGLLSDLADVSPAKAALMIARAEDKALAAKKPITKAPAPLSAAKGTATGEKPLQERSGDELRKWLYSS